MQKKKKKSNVIQTQMFWSLVSFADFPDLQKKWRRKTFWGLNVETCVMMQVHDPTRYTTGPSCF